MTADSVKHKLREKYDLSGNLERSITNTITALTTTLTLSVLASIALGGIA